MKTIVLIDLFSGGHRDAFMRLFAQACLQTDAKVVCLFPESDKIKDWLTIHAKEHLNHIIFVDYKPVLKKFKKFGRLNDAINALSYWRSCAEFLRNTEQQYHIKIDLVYFNWIDNQMANYLPGKILDIFFTYKWSGLYFHPVVFRITPKYLENKATFRDVDGVFLSDNCVAITLHDEGILEKYQKRIEKNTILFPEIADATPPNPSQLLAAKIKEKAAGRTIVGIIGLEPYKGTLALIRLTKKADSSKFFFAFTGVYKEEFISNLKKEEQEEYRHFLQNLPENCIWQTGGLQEGEEYNSVFCSFDIVYIMYKNFYSSSNRLTKAALFKKLVLANNYGCVGDDIPTYHLGETADEDNIEEQYQKLEILRSKIMTKNYPVEQWKIYAGKHSTERLKEKFEELLKLV